MAKYKQGVFGGVRGRIGNVINSSWKGINYMRIMPAEVNDANTPLQVRQRVKFGLAIQFMKPFVAFLRIGFKYVADKMSPFNAAVSYTLRNAVSGTFPSVHIDPAAVMLSVGELRPVYDATATSTEPGKVHFTWEDNSELNEANPDDNVILIVYNETKRDVVYKLDGATRAAGSADLLIPDSYQGDTMHCYIACTTLNELVVAGNSKCISNSVFVGTL